MSENLSESLEDCLEVIWHLVKANGVARMRDVSRGLKVSGPSVNSSVKRLKRGGFVNYETYGYITLTRKGSATARAVAARHEAVENFLHLVLKVSAKRASEEACRLEHTLSPDTVRKLRRLTRKLLAGQETKGRKRK